MPVDLESGPQNLGSPEIVMMLPKLIDESGSLTQLLEESVSALTNVDSEASVLQ
jgi:hypothetical protein